MQETEFNFKCDWNGAFEDPEFIKTFSTEILENYILKNVGMRENRVRSNTLKS